ncbi:hypothetical protein QFC22_001642 [Naganishia vaughanmartiniae]|uniref:Uncharacterized protein n=1 Tax=Naganishia vaughanmartiniae TaxID=1424756 RepID=A0ACC2XJ39_9TREE|nr:hypothetical protein QFC22_001642 [Naganishia vaughanmartiniae]
MDSTEFRKAVCKAVKDELTVRKIKFDEKEDLGGETLDTVVWHYINGYWNTAATAYARPTDPVLQSAYKAKVKRDRRKGRQKRVSDESFNHGHLETSLSYSILFLKYRKQFFAVSPLSSVPGANLLRLALANENTPMPEYLSDDEDEPSKKRFVETEELPERRYWYQLHSGQMEYRKTSVLELKDLFWVTPEVSGSVILDEV